MWYLFLSIFYRPAVVTSDPIRGKTTLVVHPFRIWSSFDGQYDRLFIRSKSAFILTDRCCEFPSVGRPEAESWEGRLHGHNE